MNDNKVQQDDILKDLFKELPLEKVSDSFTVSTMSKVEKIQRHKKRRSQWLTVLLPVSGIVMVVCITSFLFYFTGIKVPQIDIDFQLILLKTGLFFKQNTSIFAIGFLVLLLLIADFLLRNYFDQKKGTKVSSSIS